jgi:DNA-binding MarR family transcriptional regulator
VLDHPDLDLDAQLCFPLYAATRAVTRVYTDLLSASGLTYPQYLSMLALWGAEEPMTVGELGRRLELDSGTLTPLLKRLEGRGVVARHRDPRDERRVLVEVTDAGWALRDDVAPVPRLLANALTLTRGEAAELRRLLAKVVDGLPDA